MGQTVKTAVALGEHASRARFLDALYREYSRALIRFISRRNVSPDEAREIVQETYCRLQQVPQVERLESPRGYLFRTAINLVRDSKRQRRREMGHTGAAGAASAGDVPSEAPSAYQTLKAEQELTIIRRAIGELSPSCRQVFVLHRFESATYAQIAERLGLSVSMIEKHVSHALAHLKASLDAANSAEPLRKAGP